MTTPHAPLLLVDDDRAFRQVYSTLLQAEGLTLIEADDRERAQAMFEAHTPDIVLLDLMLPPDGTVEGGLEQLRSFLAARPGVKIIVVSGAGDTHFMLQAVKSGAYDFLTKPVDPDVLLIVVQRALTRVALERQVQTLQDTLAQTRPVGGMIGRSPTFRNAIDFALRVAPTQLPVLITGENGTGKELMARTVHEHSARADAPFIVVNCGALPETLFESALFGHVKGAFTGAANRREGLFQQADTGTLFLDEVGDIPLALQVKLLRALEQGEILPVGAERTRRVDVRIVSATNRDLDTMQREGNFREDLYWRLKGTEIRLPALRERSSDIPLLATHFLNLSAPLCADGRARTLSPAVEHVMTSHRWPGNLRELRFEMQRASIMAGERHALEPTDLSFVEHAHTTRATPSQTLADKVADLERREIEAALAQHHGNRTHAAAALGLSRQGLLNKIARYRLEG